MLLFTPIFLTGCFSDAGLADYVEQIKKADGHELDDEMTVIYLDTYDEIKENTVKLDLLYAENLSEGTSNEAMLDLALETDKVISEFNILGKELVDSHELVIADLEKSNALIKEIKNNEDQAVAKKLTDALLKEQNIEIQLHEQEQTLVNLNKALIDFLMESQLEDMTTDAELDAYLIEMDAIFTKLYDQDSLINELLTELSTSKTEKEMALKNFKDITGY